METVLKTVLVLVASVGSNPTPSAAIPPSAHIKRPRLPVESAAGPAANWQPGCAAWYN